MRLITNFLPALFLCCFCVGCQMTKITNLTPARMERNSEGLYPIEAAWETREHAFRPESLKPQVMVGSEVYSMQPVAVVKDRFEAMVPVPPDQDHIRYRFKFDYEYNAIPVPRPNSKLSPEYKLEIVDEK